MLLREDSSSVYLLSRRSEFPALSSSPLSLSLLLRGETADLHREVEHELDLPRKITTLTEYKRLLERFYRLYRPLELKFTRLTGWSDIGIDPFGCVHSAKLAADLQALGIAPLGLLDAPESSQPALVDFAHALGVSYVIEGSALGSRVILPHLVSVLGEQIVNADSFFQGRGDHTGAFWSAFRTSLDRYGVEHCDRRVDVVSGARSAFTAIGAWVRS